MKLTVVEIDPYGDGYIALYKDGFLVTGGDEYHDDIGAFVDGYCQACNELCEGKFEQVVVECNLIDKNEDWTCTDFTARDTLQEYLAHLSEEGYVIGPEMVSNG